MKGFSLDLYELHALPSVKDTGDYGDTRETISEDCSGCYEAYLTAPMHGQQIEVLHRRRILEKQDSNVLIT